MLALTCFSDTFYRVILKYFFYLTYMPPLPSIQIFTVAHLKPLIKFSIKAQGFNVGF